MSFEIFIFCPGYATSYALMLLSNILHQKTEELISVNFKKNAKLKLGAQIY